MYNYGEKNKGVCWPLKSSLVFSFIVKGYETFRKIKQQMVVCTRFWESLIESFYLSRHVLHTNSTYSNSKRSDRKAIYVRHMNTINGLFNRGNIGDSYAQIKRKTVYAAAQIQSVRSSLAGRLKTHFSW